MEDKFVVLSSIRKILSDRITPVGAYLSLRAHFPHSLLLEGSDYSSAENSFSYICADRLAGIQIVDGEIHESLPNNKIRARLVSEFKKKDIAKSVLTEFLGRFSEEYEGERPELIINGLFGFLSYESVSYMEEIELHSKVDPEEKIPVLQYNLFRYVLAFDHFHQQLYILENSIQGLQPHRMDIVRLLETPCRELPKFRLKGESSSPLSDNDYAEIVKTCKRHIQRGDVFQIVPARKFSQSFEGEPFWVYRALRSINPSPYLFYFDNGDFALFGSSPEAQIVVRKGKATIHPIAGTYRRSGDVKKDQELVKSLGDDPKESAEHVMLVDLARNDLSIHCYPVSVGKFKEVKSYSHVIHLVSEVTGTLNSDSTPIEILCSTFPAGTLTGAPKYRAMQLIDELEAGARNFYGGTVGMIGFNGEINHAIIIRSFLAKNNKLYSQAGAGVVLDSVPEKETEEVYNKLRALNKAAIMAEEVSK